MVTLGPENAIDAQRVGGTEPLTTLDSWFQYPNRNTVILPGVVVYQRPPMGDMRITRSEIVSYSGGVVRIQWEPPFANETIPPEARTPLPGESYSYQIYRVQVVEAVTNLTLLTTTSDTSFMETHIADGNYCYGVASVVSSNGVVSTGALVRASCFELDRTPPLSASNLVILAMGGGYNLYFNPPEFGLTPYLFHGASPFSSTNGRACIQGKDVTFSQIPMAMGPNYYGVVVVDQYSNASPLSVLVYTNIPSVPVNQMTVNYARGGSPILAWGHTNRAATLGFSLFKEAGGTTTKITDSLLSPWTASYMDPDYDGSNCQYGVRATAMSGTNRVDSLTRWIELPRLSATLDTNSTVKRGILNRLAFDVANRSGHDISNISFSVHVQGVAYTGRTVSVSADTTSNIVVVVGGYSNLENRVTVSNALTFSPVYGNEVCITDTNSLPVGNDRFVVDIIPEQFFRGGTGRARFTLQNTSQDDIEIVMAKENGTASSPEIRMKLLDKGGFVYSTGNVLQALGPDLATLSDGTTVARIAAGRTYTSSSITMQVSSLLGTGAVVKLEIDKIHYRMGWEDHVAMGGPGATKRVSFDDTPYSVWVTNVTPSWSITPTDFALSGIALFKSSSAPAARMPVRVIVGLRGFERVYNLITDSAGRWSMVFRPLHTEGGLYDVYAMHPELVEKSAQQQFEIRRVMVAPTALHVTIPRNYSYQAQVAVTPNLDLALNGAYLAYREEDQTNGVFAEGISVTPGPPVSIKNGRTGTLWFTLRGNDSAPETGTLFLRLVSAGNENTPWNTVRVRYTLAGQAEPNLVWSPSYVEAGVTRSNSITARVNLQNVGFLDLQNVGLTLVTTNGQPAPDWVMLNSASSLGTLATGETKMVNVTFSPTNGVPLTPIAPYRFNLRVTADNYVTSTVPLYVMVDESGVGGASFHISDIYTGTLDAQGQTIRGLAGARISLTKESGVELRTNLVTDAWGEAEVARLPAGRYTARISAPEHKAQTARVWIKEGLVHAQEIFLDNSLVTVEWSVTPTVIQDQYEVTLTTTYRTEVPAAVLVTEPTSVTLPTMEAGDVFNGEFTVKNYGLIQAEDAVITLPPVSDDYKLEIMAELPSVIPAHGVIRMPYRVIRLSSRVDETAGGGGCGQLCAGISAKYKCPSNAKANSGASFCASALCSEGDMGDFTETISEWFELSASPGAAGGGKSELGKVEPPKSAVPAPDADDECKGSQSGEEKDPDCGGAGEAEEPVGSAVDLVAGKFVDSIVDLVVPVLGHDLTVTRTFTGNKWHWNFITSTNDYARVFPDGMTIQRTQIDQDMQEVDPIDGFMVLWTESDLNLYWRGGAWNCLSYKLGSDCWPLQSSPGTVGLTIESNTLRYTISADETWVYDECAVTNLILNRLSRRDSWSRLVKRISPQGIHLSYAYDLQGRTEAIYDHFGHRVLWMNYDANGRLDSVSDAGANGHTVRYQYDASGNLTNALDARGFGHAYAYQNGKLVFERTRGGREVHITHSGTNMSSLVTRTEDQLGWKEYSYGAVARNTPEGALGAKMMATILDSDNNLREIWYGVHYLTKAPYRILEKLNGEVTYRKPDASDENDAGPGALRRKPKVVTDNKSGVVTTTYEDGTQRIAQYALTGEKQAWALSIETAEDGGKTTYAYDEAGRPVTVVEAAGESDQRSVTYEYDQNGQLQVVTRQGGGATPAARTAMSINDRGLQTSITRPEGGVTQFGYDENNSLYRLITPLGHVWSNQWDQNRQLVSLVDPLGQVVSNTYDAAGNIACVRTAAGDAWHYAYDVRGRLLSLSNGYGQAWTMTYEGDRLKSSQSPGVTETYEYDNVGRVVREVNSLGASRSWQYDQLGRITNFVNQYGEFLHLQYEDNPYRTNIVWVDSGSIQITNAYDPRGRRTSSITTWGTNRSELYMNYDSVGNVTSIYRTADGWKTIQYNSHRQPTQMIDSLNHAMAWRYDDRNNLIWQKDAAGQVTEMTYDREDRQTRLVYPDGRAVSNAYDLSGNLISISDVAGRRAAYGYDALDRLVTQKFYSVGGVLERTVSYAYDANDRITSYDDGTTSGSFTLNPTNGSEGRIVNYGTFSKSHLYTYDAFDRKTSFRGPDGVTYEYGYDHVGRLISLSIPGEGVISFGNYVGQRPGRIAYPGGMVQLLSYDGLGSVTSSVVLDTAGDVLFSYACERDVNRRLISRTLDATVETYAYDALGQLEQANLPTLPSQSFAYDAMGNRTTLTVDSTSQSLQYNNRNQLTSSDGMSQTYDGDGNVCSRMYNGTNLFFEYNAEGRLSAIRNATSNLVAQYYYNAWSERLRKTVRGTNTWFYYAEEGLVAELNSTGGIQRTYGYRPNSGWSHSPLFMRVGTTTYYFLNDQIGTPRKLVAGNGQVVWTADYEPFGAAHVSSNSTVVCRLRGSSQYFDEESGLHYNTFRYYDPLTGRYFTEDPLGLDQGPNLYRFCMNDPLSFVDSQGLEPLTLGAAALLALEVVDMGMMIWDGAKCLFGSGCAQAEGCRDLAIDTAMLIAPHLVPARVALRVANVGRAGVRALTQGAKVGSKYARHLASPFMREAPKVLAHKATSGAVIRSTPGKTTTVLGNWQRDMQHVIKEVGSKPGTVAQNMAQKPNGFNVLNVEKSIQEGMSEEQFWREVEVPWLNESIARGDSFEYASNFESSTFFRDSGEMKFFGREMAFLLERGALDPTTAQQVERVLRAGPP